MELTIEMIWVLGILALTLYLLVSEIVRVGVAAMLIMVLLGPLALNIAVQASAAGSEGVNPARFALTLTLAASNSFLMPTHQANALIMGPAGDRVADFLRAEGS